MALPILAFRSHNRLALVIAMIPGIVLALIAPLLVFSVWGGLGAPSARVTAAVNPGNLLLTAGYLSLMTWLAAPAWFRLGKSGLAACGVVLLVLTLLNRVLGLGFLPFATALPRLVPQALHGWLGAGLAAAGTLVTLIFVISLGQWAWRHRRDPESMFLVLGLGLILGTTAGLNSFSSRYVAQALPFLLLILPDRDELTMAKVAGWGVAMVLGSVSLASFLFR
jgi:hypothetical protein